MKDAKQWYFMYDLAKKYYEHHSNLNITARFKTKNGHEYAEDGYNLGMWIFTQRVAYRNNKAKKKVNALDPLTLSQIKLLENIGINWEKSKSRWYRSYALVKEFYNHYGSLEIPANFKTKNGYEYDESGFNISVWIIHQRYKFNTKKLSKERISLLNEIGMMWKLEINWEDMYNLAKKYYEHYGNLRVPRYFKTENGYEYDESGYNLGEWISTQRVAYKNNKANQKVNNYKPLSSKQVELLEEIKMIWNANIYWFEVYELAQKYYEHHGDLKVPRNFKTKNGYEYDEDGYNLGKWISNQREAYKINKANQKVNKYKSLTSKQIELLEEIKMKWNINPDWFEMYALAKKYYEYYGNLRVPRYFKTKNGYEYDEKGLNLGLWIATQRVVYKNIRANIKGNYGLTEEKIKALNEIGMIWSVRKIENKTKLEQLLKSLSLECNFNFLDYPEILSLSINEVIERTLYLKEHKLPFAIDGKLNPLFFEKLEEKDKGIGLVLTSKI